MSEKKHKNRAWTHYPATQASQNPRTQPIKRPFLPKKKSHIENRLFNLVPRKLECLHDQGFPYIRCERLDHQSIKWQLASSCETIEHQFIKLRSLIQLTDNDYKQRYTFTRLFLECLERHHEARYEGILFGSTVNGLGFRDSDVDLRLRVLRNFGSPDKWEAINLDDRMVEMTLRNIAYQTIACCPTRSEFVPSVRCPVAKLKFLSLNIDHQTKHRYPREGLNYDISLSSKNTLGSYNSTYLKFLCQLSPKFHLLAIALRYWSKCHSLIQPGDLSSYALINLLIYFCQVTEQPLLPTVDRMRQIFLEREDRSGFKHRDPAHAISQIEWHCLMCLDNDAYTEYDNREPLSLLLLKFFEFCLKFPFSTHIITIRPGRCLTHEEFEASGQFHPRFPIKKYVNIQDPFDLKHNLTSGLQGPHFRKIMIAIRYSYERFYHELMNNFCRPLVTNGNSSGLNRNGEQKNKLAENDDRRTPKNDPNLWGLNVIFQKLTDVDIREA